jgi:hypothetical protein
VKTASEVLERIDAEIEKMQHAAAGPCIDALIEWTDREAYREAMRRAYALKAVQGLREALSKEIEPAPAQITERKPTKRAK